VNPTVFKKICLLGDFAVGKTSLVRRFVDNQFSDEYLSTIGVKLSRKLVQVPRIIGTPIHMQLVLWDLEGKEDFSSTSSSYLRGASGAIIVGDQTRPETMVNTRNHIKVFLSVNPQACIVIACNKDDVREKERPPIMPAFEGHERVVLVQQTSAKIGNGVANLFEALSKKLIEN
jgi:small GTP-binding protein